MPEPVPTSKPKPLHLGILQTDSVLEDLQPRFGDYPSMFEDLFRAADPTMRFTTYNVQQALPASLDCDAYLITGCKLSVYDDLPWIAELADFVRMAMAAQKKILGICFGQRVSLVVVLHQQKQEYAGIIDSMLGCNKGYGYIKRP